MLSEQPYVPVCSFDSEVQTQRKHEPLIYISCLVEASFCTASSTHQLLDTVGASKPIQSIEKTKKSVLKYFLRVKNTEKKIKCNSRITLSHLTRQKYGNIKSGNTCIVQQKLHCIAMQ